MAALGRRFEALDAAAPPVDVEALAAEFGTALEGLMHGWPGWDEVVDPRSAMFGDLLTAGLSSAQRRVVELVSAHLLARKEGLS